MDNDEERLAKIESEITEQNKKLKPIEAKIRILQKRKDKIIEDRDLKHAYDFDYLISNQSAWTLLRQYCKEFQGATHSYFGVRNEGYFPETSQASFSMNLSVEGSEEAAQKFIEHHVGMIKPITPSKRLPTMVPFQYNHRAHDFAYVAWDGDKWMIIYESRYEDPVVIPQPDLKSALALAKEEYS